MTTRRAAGHHSFATSADLASAISAEQSPSRGMSHCRNASDVTLAAAIADLQSQIDAINAALGGARR
jgi:hypothetical protein